MKKILPSIIAIIFLAAGCNASTKPSENQNTSIPQESPKAQDINSKTSNKLLTYTNVRYGFEFKYPSTWKVVNETVVDNNLLLKVDLAGPDEIQDNKYTATLSVYSGSSYGNDLNRMVQVTEDLFGKMQDTQIAGEPAKKIIARSSGGSKKLTLKADFIHKGLGYRISSTGWVKDEYLAVADVEALLATFKFLE